MFFVIPPLTQLLPASWSGTFVQYLPSNAGGMLIDGTYGREALFRAAEEAVRFATRPKRGQ